MLAVIVILAIVLGIAVPGVLGIIHRAEKNAFKQSAGMLLETGRIYYGQRKMDRNSIKDQESFYFPETTELEYSGETPKDGYLTIYEDGSQYIEITNGTYCAYGEQASDIKVKDGLCQDQTPGVLAGTGTERDPYKIESIEDLVQFGKNVDGGNTYENKYVTLEKSLDFKNEKNYVNSKRTDYGDINENGVVEPLFTELTTEKGFNPIGNYISSTNNLAFLGNFNGKNEQVSNLRIVRGSENGVGLFANINYPSILRNVTVSGEITGFKWGGLLSGMNKGNQIHNCHGNGNVKVLNATGGGLIGILNPKDMDVNQLTGQLTDCSFSGIVRGRLAVGGLAGQFGGTVRNIVVNATVTGNEFVGGIGSGYGTMRNVFFHGKVTGESSVGGAFSRVASDVKNLMVDAIVDGGQNVGGITGVMGFSNDSLDEQNRLLSNLYFIGSVSGNRNVGGLIGRNGVDNDVTRPKVVTIKNGYSLGQVSGTDSVGGVVGSSIMGLQNLYAGGDVSGSTNVGNIVGRKENEDSTITNVYSKEGQQVSGSNVLTLGTVVSLPTLSPSSWWKNTLGFDNNWKFEEGYYPLLYKVDENGNPTNELLPGQKKIPILSS